MNIFDVANFEPAEDGPPSVRVEFSRELRSSTKLVLAQVLWELAGTLDEGTTQLEKIDALPDPWEVIPGPEPLEPVEPCLDASSVSRDELIGALPARLLCSVRGVPHVWWQATEQGPGRWYHLLLGSRPPDSSVTDGAVRRLTGSRATQDK